MASKLKQLWWLMLIFAVCNVVMAVMLYQSSSPEPVNEDVVPVAAKNVYSIGILQSDDLAEQNKMTAGVLAALEAEGYSKGGRAKIDIVQAKGNDKKLETSAKKFARDKKGLNYRHRHRLRQSSRQSDEKHSHCGSGGHEFQEG